MNEVFKHGEFSSSEKLNTIIDGQYNQISNIVDELNSLKIKAKEEKVINNVQYEFLKRRLMQLSRENIDLKQSLYNANKYNKLMNIQAKDFKSDNTSTLIDKTFNIISFNCANEAPISYINTSKGAYIPKDLKIQTNDNFSNINYTENNIYNCIDNDIKTYWHREYHFNKNSTINEVNVEVIIDMPYAHINKYKYNNVQIRPYPFKSENITSIQVLADGIWTEIGKNYLDAENIYIQGYSSSIEKIKINIHQDEFVLINNEKIFYVGLNNVLVSLNKTNSNSIQFYYDLCINQNMSINDVNGIFKNNELLSNKDIFEYEIQRVNKDSFTSKIDKIYPIYLKKGDMIRFIVTLFSQEVMPVFQSLNIMYSHNI